MAALEAFTRDVYLYLRRVTVRDAIDNIVRAAITTEPTVVVAHSLGSVVAYNILRTADAAYNVPLLVTVGCPLGITTVRDQLIPLRYPRTVHQWYNAFDTRDVVALYPLSSENFPVTPPIINNSSIQNEIDNRHGISGYLSNKQVAQQVLDTIGS